MRQQRRNPRATKQTFLLLTAWHKHRFGQSYHGMMALQTGFLVAFTQLIPEHQVQLFGGLAKLRVKVRFLASHTHSFASTA